VDLWEIPGARVTYAAELRCQQIEEDYAPTAGERNHSTVVWDTEDTVRDATVGSQCECIGQPEGKDETQQHPDKEGCKGSE
jgi:hypothetical protein